MINPQPFHLLVAYHVLIGQVNIYTQTYFNLLFILLAPFGSATPLFKIITSIDQ